MPECKVAEAAANPTHRRQTFVPAILRSRTRVFSAYLVLTTLALVLPIPIPIFWSTAVVRFERDWNGDKVVHAVLFVGLAYLAAWSRGRGPPWRTYVWTFAAATLFGAGIELIQAGTTYRKGDVLDLVADTVGAACGVALAIATRGVGWRRTSPISTIPSA